MNIIKRLTHQPFWVNLLAAICFLILLAILFFLSLGFITHHGDVVKVPAVTGLQADAAMRELQAGGFKVVVEDSAYVDSIAPLTVLRQSPEGNFTVKVNRTIYLTLNKVVPPMTAMPDLVNLSFRSAAMTLQSLRLNLGDTTYRPDIAKNAVLDQLYNGQAIKPGTQVPEGAHISLVLGDGVGNIASAVPNLIGLTLLQAKDLLSASNLNRGVVLFDGPITDTANAYIIRQLPAPKNNLGGDNMIRAGESVDLWVSQIMPLSTDSNAVQP